VSFKNETIGGKAWPGGDWQPVIVEIYEEVKSGKGDVKHVRPVEGQNGFPSSLDAKLPEDLKAKHNAGTQFRMWGMISNRTGSGDYVNSSHHWMPELIKNAKA
jgi:hypothetical protein